LVQLERDPAWEFVDTPGKIRRQLEKEVARDIDDEFVRVRAAADDLDEFFASIGSPRPPGSRRKR
jgi:hypothetical protein